MKIQNVVCLGYAKCGTTLLDATFRGSSIVATPKERKEIKFFLKPQYPDEEQYGQYLKCFFSDGKVPVDVGLTFEASPPYCHQAMEGFREVLARIKSTLPEPKVVMCFRHPVARAYSHYIHNLHAFALYGDGVFGGRNLLPSRIFRKSFRQSLGGSPRIMTHYFSYLEAAYEILGKDKVMLFFLESDVSRFGDWVEALAGAAVAQELGLGDAPPSMVIPRRPVPNYVVKDGVLIAFGSREGELVRYDGLEHAQRREVLDSRQKWTLELDNQEIQSLVEEYFAEDLKRCAELTGDDRFTDYMSNPPERQVAVLTNGKMLQTLHGVGS